jgi:hypothetical protein
MNNIVPTIAAIFVWTKENTPKTDQKAPNKKAIFSD